MNPAWAPGLINRHTAAGEDPMTTMTAPREPKNLDIYGSPPLEWERVIEALDRTRVAALFGGWDPQVRDGAFWHEYSAPSAGPPPWDVYEITPTTIFAVATAEPNGATRWKL
jgi:hypothetical protein